MFELAILLGRFSNEDVKFINSRILVKFANFLQRVHLKCVTRCHVKELFHSYLRVQEAAGGCRDLSEENVWCQIET